MHGCITVCSGEHSLENRLQISNGTEETITPFALLCAEEETTDGQLHVAHGQIRKLLVGSSN